MDTTQVFGIGCKLAQYFNPFHAKHWFPNWIAYRK